MPNQEIERIAKNTMADIIHISSPADEEIETIAQILRTSLLQVHNSALEQAKEGLEGEKAFTDYPDTQEGRQNRHENSLYNSALSTAIEKLESLKVR